MNEAQLLDIKKYIKELDHNGKEYERKISTTL